MNRTLWLALPALMLVSHAWAQTAPAPTAPAAPTTPAAPAAPKAPAAPAKPTAAAPAKPAAPAVAKSPATPAAPAAAKSPAAPAAAKTPAATPAHTPASPVATTAKTPTGPAGKAPVSAQAAPPAAAAAAATKPAPAKPGPVDWTLDAGHSKITFVTKHLGFSKVEGEFEKFSATIKADSKSGKISALEATVDTASVDTGIEKRDAHLKGDDFFNSAQYPQMKLVLKTINWAGNKFTAKVDLTIRDVTKTVTFKGELLGSGTVNFGQGPTQRAGYEAIAKINRKDFGLKYAAVTEGLAIVADEVEIRLQAEIGYTPPQA